MAPIIIVAFSIYTVSPVCIWKWKTGNNDRNIQQLEECVERKDEHAPIAMTYWTPCRFDFASGVHFKSIIYRRKTMTLCVT